MLLEFLQFALETLERVSIVWGAGQMDLMCHWRRLAAHKSWCSLLPFTRSWKSRRFHFSCKWASIFGANGFFFIKKNGGRCLFVFFIFSLKRKRKKKAHAAWSASSATEWGDGGCGHFAAASSPDDADDCADDDGQWDETPSGLLPGTDPLSNDGEYAAQTIVSGVTWLDQDPQLSLFA